jgi:hypothetical protein
MTLGNKLASRMGGDCGAVRLLESRGKKPYD